MADAVQLSIFIPILSPSESLLSRWANAPQLGAKLERAIQSILDQEGFDESAEIIVLDDQTRGRIVEHIKEIFVDPRIRGNLCFYQAEKSRQSGAEILNQAAGKARGAVLAFCDPYDTWEPGFLKRLLKLSERFQLALASKSGETFESHDWIRSFLIDPPAVQSFTLIRRPLFEKIKGFSESSLVMTSHLGLWLKALIRLKKEDKLNKHFYLFENSGSESLKVEPQAHALDPVKEALSITSLVPRIPRAYWPLLAKRFGSAGKGLIQKQVLKAKRRLFK